MDTTPTRYTSNEIKTYEIGSIYHPCYRCNCSPCICSHRWPRCPSPIVTSTITVSPTNREKALDIATALKNKEMVDCEKTEDFLKLVKAVEEALEKH